MSDFIPNNYKIKLEIDLNRSTFQGTCTLNIKAENPTEKLTLNADQLAIWKCQINKDEINTECSFSLNPHNQELVVDFPEKIENTFEIVIQYTGKFNNELLGFYRSKYEHEGKEKYVASTQFEESFARRAFPCFDHPSKKATFDIEYVIDENLVAISNTAILEEKQLDENKKLVRFEQTPKMSTYLLYFGVGEFEQIEDQFNGHTVRVITTPGKTEYGKFAMDMAGKSLIFCEEYTGIKYPISKCDLIGVPDFPFGAMENYGAITFRETAFLLYPEITSTAMKLLIAGITAHEVSHFWFGDLVSPTEWRDIWLNESFASFFTFAIPNHYYPEWNVWEGFFTRYYISALERDALIETFPVELPIEEKDFISPAKIDIIYSKGACILRMCEGYLGEDDFKKGINLFLKKYQFSCANTQQYWDTFEEATGKPIKKFADSWIHQPGYPIIYVKREKDELILTQERFTFLPHTSDLKWYIPVNIIIFQDKAEPQVIRTILEEKTQKISIPTETTAFKLNVNQTGFYRVKYEKEEIIKLGQLIIEGKITSIDRYGIENDFYALVKRGHYTLDQYLELIDKYFVIEEDYLPLTSILSNLRHAYLILDTKRKEISEIGLLLLKNYIDKYGIKPIEGEEISRAILRNSILRSAFLLGNQSAVDIGSKLFQNLLDGNKVHQDVLSSVLKIGAATNDKATDYLLKKVMAPETPDIEKLYILEALGCYQEKKDILNALNINLNQVPIQNRHYIFGLTGRNPKALKYLWKWFRENFKKLEEQPLMVYGRTIASLIPTGGLDHETEVKQFFEEYMREKDIAHDTIKMTLEKLEINSKMREN